MTSLRALAILDRALDKVNIADAAVVADVGTLGRDQRVGYRTSLPSNRVARDTAYLLRSTLARSWGPDRHAALRLPLPEGHMRPTITMDMFSPYPSRWLWGVH
jgi:hypothetical protein